MALLYTAPVTHPLGTGNFSRARLIALPLWSLRQKPTAEMVLNTMISNRLHIFVGVYAPDAIYLAVASSGRGKTQVQSRESRQALERKRKTKEKKKVETPLCRPRRATAQFMLATRRSQTSVRLLDSRQDRSMTPQNVRDLGQARPFPPSKLGPHAPRFSTMELDVLGGQGGRGGKKKGGSGLARGSG